MKPLKFIFSFLLFSLVISSCRKKGTDVFPKLEGMWQSGLACYDPCDFSYLRIDQESNGVYETSIDMFGQSTRYEGKVKVSTDSILYVAENEFYKIYEIKDTFGYHVNGANCYCYGTDMDSVPFIRIMRTSNGTRYIFDM